MQAPAGARKFPTFVCRRGPAAAWRLQYTNEYNNNNNNNNNTKIYNAHISQALSISDGSMLKKIIL